MIIPDHELEDMGNIYRIYCGPNDAMMIAGKIVTFEMFLCASLGIENSDCVYIIPEVDHGPCRTYAYY